MAALAAKPTFPKDRALRIFSGTYNVRGRPHVREDGQVEEIPADQLGPWLRHVEMTTPDILFFAFQVIGLLP